MSSCPEKMLNRVRHDISSAQNDKRRIHLGKKIRIGVFADKGMGKWLVQSFEPLKDMADITLFISDNNKHDPSSFNLTKHLLTHKHET